MIGGITVNGQLVVAVAVAIDAAFGLLVALGIIHTRPDMATILSVVTVAFNTGLFLWAYIQHSQHVTALKTGSAERQAMMQYGGVGAGTRADVSARR